MNRRTHSPVTPARPADWVWLLAIFLVGFGARLWLIHSWGTPLPFWDQWEEARIVYAPYFGGKLSLAELFAAHNEHRMFFNRFYDLGMLLLNGQWDNQLETVASALIYVSAITGFGWVIAARIGRRSWPIIALLLMLGLALPFGWENTLGGFHSQVYTAIVFSLLMIWLLGCQKPGTVPWIFGVLAAFGAVCAPTSGIIAGAAILALVTLEIVRRPSLLKQHWLTFPVCIVVLGIGLALRVDVPHHRVLMAHSLSQFVLSLGKYLAWPWIVVPPFALFNMLPLLLLAWFYLRKREACLPGEALVLGLGLWVMLQAAASAYARGAQLFPQWRYMDSTCFVMIVNGLSIILLLRDHLKTSRRMKTLWASGFCLWAVACAAGLTLLSMHAWSFDLPERRFYSRCQLENMRLFMATGDITAFDRKPNQHLPLYEGDPNAPKPRHAAEKLVRYLDNPYIRPLLPACVRDPLGVVPATAGGFVTNSPLGPKPKIAGEVFWSSYSASGSTNQGRFESMPISPGKFPFLEFRVAGDLGKPGLSLDLLELGSGRITSVKPDQAPGNTWKNCRVRAPRGDFKIVAVDDSGTGWLAFQSPRGVAWLSWAAALLASYGSGLFAIGVLLYAGGVVVALRARRAGQPVAESQNPGPPAP